jgi:hypothetical protein
MEDAILKEVWAAKDRIAARYRGNVKKYMSDLRRAHANSSLATSGTQKTGAKARRKSK